MEQHTNTTKEDTVVWLKDSKGLRYRCVIDGCEYIRTNRRERKKPKRRVLSEDDKVKRRVYMKQYRRDERAKTIALKRLVADFEQRKDEDCQND